MDLETPFKLVTAIAGLVSFGKFVVEFDAGRRNGYRQEYKFAREFLDDIRKTPKMHAFLRQKGYQALAGDNDLSAEEVEYVLELPSPARALRLYVRGLPYLQHTATAMGSQVSFKREYRSREVRTSLKAAFFFGFLGLYALGVAPFFGVPLKVAGLPSPLAQGLLTAILCLPLPALSLWSGMRITAAELLVNAQPDSGNDLTGDTLDAVHARRKKRVGKEGPAVPF